LIEENKKLDEIEIEPDLHKINKIKTQDEFDDSEFSKSTLWTKEEKLSFYEAVRKHGKDWAKITAELKEKERHIYTNHGR